VAAFSFVNRNGWHFPHHLQNKIHLISFLKMYTKILLIKSSLLARSNFGHQHLICVSAACMILISDLLDSVKILGGGNKGLCTTANLYSKLLIYSLMKVLP